MSSLVYFADFHARSDKENKVTKIAALCDALGFKKILRRGESVAVKVHFGELGNDTHVNPTFVREVVEKVEAAGGKPFLTDSSTLYSGSRRNAVDHLQTAYRHGFSPSVVKAPVIIADGITGENDDEVAIGCKHFEKVFIAREIRRASSMVVLSHFKGHEMAGFGGAIKNLAMGGASPRGKRAQHSTKVQIDGSKCTGCGNCVKVCPQKALSLKGEKSQLNPKKCIGCFECITVCPSKAAGIDWDTDLPLFVERLTEYAYGAVKGRERHVCYINFVMNVTPDCDCCAWSDTFLVPDQGILASTDPVALDQACLDLVTKAVSLDPKLAGKKNVDKFKAYWKKTHGDIQLSYGEEIGLGKRKYTLKTI
ncbi:MAG: DUF362 domain-containing protein [Desulfovibrio sp.]|jgi:uncharacterized Fe-S center protein|nr:DUF362 domain-containing protein [Desulfovibrio sp.]